MSLDVDRAHRVVGEIAEKLGLAEDEAAAGIVTILNNNMANAIRSRTVQKGIDPRDFALMTFGGAGPLHGAEVADMLGIPEVIVPAYPGITSALGLLTSDLKYDSIRTQFQVSTELNLERLNNDFVQMREDLLRQFAADNILPSAVTLNFATPTRAMSGRAMSFGSIWPTARSTTAPSPVPSSSSIASMKRNMATPSHRARSKS